MLDIDFTNRYTENMSSSASSGARVKIKTSMRRSIPRKVRTIGPIYLRSRSRSQSRTELLIHIR